MGMMAVLLDVFTLAMVGGWVGLVAQMVHFWLLLRHGGHQCSTARC